MRSFPFLGPSPCAQKIAQAQASSARVTLDDKRPIRQKERRASRGVRSRGTGSGQNRAAALTERPRLSRGTMIMVDSKMMAQISTKDGFIAALDQSGGSTPGALRLYGVPDNAYSGEA